MKKCVCVFLVTLILCSVAGCSGSKKTDESIKDAPEYIANMFNTMNKIAKENNFKFTACDYRDNSDYYSFSLQYTNVSSY